MAAFPDIFIPAVPPEILVGLIPVIFDPIPAKEAAVTDQAV